MKTLFLSAFVLLSTTLCFNCTATKPVENGGGVDSSDTEYIRWRKYDTAHIRVTVKDTVHVTVKKYDTAKVYIQDTVKTSVTITDTTKKNITVLDTTHKPFYVYDTSHKTVKVYDTLTVLITKYDTAFNHVTVTDTAHKKITVNDTLHKNVTVYDTTHKSVIRYDTTFKKVTVIDTIRKTVTVYDTVHVPVNPPPKQSTNFGVLINNSSYSPAMKAAKSKDLLKVDCVRGGTVISSFNGTDRSFETYSSYGLKKVWNINFIQQTSGARDRKIDTVLFRKNLEAFFKKYKPEVIVVENETDNDGYYFGSANGYLAELRIATELAHKYHVKVSDAGLHDDYLRWYAAKDYQQRKLNDSLNWWMNLTFTPIMKSAWSGKQNNFSDHISFYDTLLNGMQKIDFDYWNMHVYQDVSMPDISLTYLQTFVNWGNRFFKKPMISNEWGLKNAPNPSKITELLNAFRTLNMPYAICFSGDGDDKAQSLFNSNGTLNVNGIAFENFIAMYNLRQ